MGGDIEQAAIIALAMDFEQQAAQLFQQANAHRFIIDEGAGFSVGRQTPAQHDFAICRHGLFGKQRARSMVR